MDLLTGSRNDFMVRSKTCLICDLYAMVYIKI